MKINQMRFFVEVCNQGSITKAAEILHVTQPAVSQAIKELEQEHDVILFRREKSGLVLTHEGSFILLDVKEILGKIDLLSQKMSYIGKSKHLIRVGFPPMIAIATFDIVEKYREQHPNITFEFYHEASSLLRRKISDGAIDLCLATGDNSYLYHCETQKFDSYEVCSCVNTKHRFARRTSVSWDEVVKEKLVVYKDPTRIGQAIQLYLNKYITPETEIFACNNTSVHYHLITQYNYCGFVYKKMADKQPGIVGISLDDPIFVDVDIVYQTNITQNKDISNFLNYLRSKRGTEFET